MSTTTLEEKYVVVGGTYYHKDTRPVVRNAIEKARKDGRPVRIYYGDQETGKSWMDENDMIGRIGRSMGPIKIPLLVKKNAHGGGGILDHCIIRIRFLNEKEDIWCHSKFHLKKMDIVSSTQPGYTHSILMDGEVYSNHKSLNDACKLVLHLS